MSNIDYQKLLAGLELRKMPVEEFARVLRLDGVRFASRARLNIAFRDAKEPLRDDTARQVQEVWDEIELMCFEALPWPVDLSNGVRVHASLQIFRGLRALQGNEINSTNETTTVPSHNIGDGGDRSNPISEQSK